MLALLVVALGLSKFAATGSEVSGIGAHTRLRLRVIVGLFKTTAPILGLQFGPSLASTLSHAAHSIGVASEGAHP